MKKMKIVNIVGARPQFIKVALFRKAARRFPGIKFVIVHTGQHYDANMSDIFFRDLDMPKPDYNLKTGSLSTAEQTARMAEGIDRVLAKESPDMVFVYGDTNSTLAGSLAAAKAGIPLAHVEAGLRSFNRKMPEEINRIITDHIADILFAPTITAVRNLKKECIRKGVYLTPDVMLDMLVAYSKVSKNRSRILTKLGVKPKRYYLATVHRSYNTDDVKRLKNLISVFNGLDKPVVFPVHPRTKKALSLNRLRVAKGNIIITEPVPYIDMLMLEMNAAAILTDSGGVQKEAHFFRVPCVTLREETEWVETVMSGWNIVAGVRGDKIRNALKRFASGREKERGVKKKDAMAARKMLDIALKYIKERS